MSTLLKAEKLHTYFPVHGGLFKKVVGEVKAVNNVSLTVDTGEIVAIVGESGCGKSTLGYSLLGLTPITSGSLWLNGNSIDIANPHAWDIYRKDFQIIFQDPYTSLNPRHTVFEIIAEPLRIHKLCEPSHLKDTVASLLQRVGLSPDYMHRFPHAFSGGQRQRLGIARAIGLKPKLIVCDEVVAALDVSVQAQIMQLLLDLKQEMGLSLLFISHDLSLVHAVSDRVEVMYLGKIVEKAKCEDLFTAPQHPYTQALLDSIPTLDRKIKPKLLSGEIPSPVNLPKGCAFSSRCPKVQPECLVNIPQLRPSHNTQAACFFPAL